MSIKIAQPIWQHPVSVMMVDDDKNLLEGNSHQLNDHSPYVLFTNPKKALKYLEQHVLPVEPLSHEIEKRIEFNDDQKLIPEKIFINFFSLRNNLDKADRFSYCAIVVVDQKMEEMEGLEFCRQVRKLGLPVKLILLTGNVGDKDAIAAFNENSIDGFVKKSPDMMKAVNQLISKLTFEAFRDASAQLMGPIIKGFPLLSKDEFANFLLETTKLQGVVEYCILDASCSYLFITAEGKLKVFWNKLREDFDAAYELATDDKSINMDSSVLDRLKNRTGFPFTGIDKSYYLSDPSQWKEKMVPMKHHKELDCYYTVIDIPLIDVLSFDHYVDEIWEPRVID